MAGRYVVSNLTPTDRRQLRSDLARDNRLWKMGYDAGLLERKHLVRAGLAGLCLYWLSRHFLGTVVVVGVLVCVVAALAIQFWPLVLALAVLIGWRQGTRKARRTKAPGLPAAPAYEPFPDDGRDAQP